MRPITFAASRNHGGGAEAMARWGPLFSTFVGRLLGAEVRLSIADDYEALLAAVERGQADVVWLPPLLQSRAEAAGARMIAVTQRGGWLTYRSAVLVRREAPYSSAHDLQRVRAAWVDPHSASGYFFPRLELVAQGATFASETFFGNAERAFSAVVAGTADLCACFVSNPTADEPARAAADIARRAGDGARELRIVHVTDQIPPDGIAVGPDLSADEQALVAGALTNLHRDEQGAAVLSQLLHADRFVLLTDALRRSLRSWMDAAASRVA